MFTNATNMTNLVDVYDFKICIQVCMWLGVSHASEFIIFSQVQRS